VRFLKALFVIVAVGSIAANVFLYYRTEKLRPQMKINGRVVTRKEYHDWLEQHYGTELMALMIKRNLILSAAEKAGVEPASQEVDQQLKDYMELKPQSTLLFQTMPWKKKDLRDQLEMDMALVNLTTKGLKVSEEELKGFFNVASSKWDVPTKLYTKMIKCQDADTAQKVFDVMQKLVKPDSNDSKGRKKFTVGDAVGIAQQFAPKAEAVWGDGKWVLWKPWNRTSGDMLIDQVNLMKPGEVKSLPFPNGGGAMLVVVLEAAEIGSGAKMDDPLIRKKVERDFKMTRSIPGQEVLRNLWDAADLEVEPAALKQSIERILLPERANQDRQAAETKQQ